MEIILGNILLGLIIGFVVFRFIIIEGTRINFKSLKAIISLLFLTTAGFLVTKLSIKFSFTYYLFGVFIAFVIYIIIHFYYSNKVSKGAITKKDYKRNLTCSDAFEKMSKEIEAEEELNSN